MADAQAVPFTRSGRFRAILAVAALLTVGAIAWWWSTRGLESTDRQSVVRNAAREARGKIEATAKQ